jgi:hypothetical protein
LFTQNRADRASSDLTVGLGINAITATGSPEYCFEPTLVVRSIRVFRDQGITPNPPVLLMRAPVVEHDDLGCGSGMADMAVPVHEEPQQHNSIAEHNE